MISWLAVKMFFDKVLLFCKKYWQICLGAGIALGVMIISAGRRNELKKALEIANKKAEEDKAAMEKAHSERIAAEQARAEEQRLAAENVAKKIHEIEKEHGFDSSKLDKKKKKKIEELLKSPSSSKEISNGIAEILGKGNVKS